MALPKPLYIFIASFVIGVAMYSYMEAGAWFSLIYLTPLLLHTKVRHFALIVIVGYTLGSLRVMSVLDYGGTPTLESQIDHEVVLKGVVISEPDIRESSSRITISIQEASGEAVETKVIVTTERYPVLAYGDMVEVRGRLQHPKNFKSESGRTFNYVSYLAKDGIFYTIPFPEVDLISSGHGSVIKRTLFSIKQSWLRNVQMHIPDPHAALAGGLVVGAKNSLGEDLEDQFRKTGIIHIVVLSGYNVTIVAESLMRFFSFLPRTVSFSLGGLSIFLFAILTGASATIVRASIMAGLVLLARATRRSGDITHTLFLAAFFMVLHNPLIVLFDPSFQLSFIATIGLVYVSPLIEEKLGFVSTRFQLREFATATMSTQLFVLPLLLYMVGEISLVALPVNMLVLACIPLTMLFGFLTGVAAYVGSALALPFSIGAYMLLSYELKVVDIFAHIPYASITVPHISIVGLGFMYVSVGVFLFYAYRKRTL